ncbi:hypothetical protein ACH5RR_002399 [Cinchona calisaya]|uniref:Uncharacterized protein n=1 Tax=Cinchona calisaya TaxID=153742 RepID=A0ABD3B651_9GENT
MSWLTIAHGFFTTILFTGFATLGGAIIEGLTFCYFAPFGLIFASMLAMAALDLFNKHILFGPNSSKIEKMVSTACQKEHADINFLLFSCFHWLAFSSIRGLSHNKPIEDVPRMAICGLSVITLVTVKLIVGYRDSSIIACWYMAVYIVAAFVSSLRDSLLFFPLLVAVLSLLIPLDCGGECPTK